jgi:hypothetical protein
MKTYYKVTRKTCHTINVELRKIGDLLNLTPNKQYHIKKMMTKSTAYYSLKQSAKELKITVDNK